MSLSEVENANAGGKTAGATSKSKAKNKGGAVAKELSKLLSTTQEISEATSTCRELEFQQRALQDELNPLLAIPTMKELDNSIVAEEARLQEVQKEIEAIKDRIADASKPSAPPLGGRAYHPSNRFKPPPSKPQSPTTLKRKINHMISEYKTRKRKCIDFCEELADAMEKKTKDVMGDKVLQLDTDEMEWGIWVDGSTGKVFGTKKKPKARIGLLGRKKNEEEEEMVKIPAKYTDV